MKPGPFIHLKGTAGLCMQMKAIILVNLKPGYQKPAVHHPLIFHDQFDHLCTVRCCTTAQPQTHELPQRAFYALFEQNSKQYIILQS